MNKLKEKLSTITDEELDTLSTRELLTYKVLCRFAIRNDNLKDKIKKFDEWFMGERMMFYKGTDGERLIRYYETQCKWKEIIGDSNE